MNNTILFLKIHFGYGGGQQCKRYHTCNQLIQVTQVTFCVQCCFFQTPHESPEKAFFVTYLHNTQVQFAGAVGYKTN